MGCAIWPGTAWMALGVLGDVIGGNWEALQDSNARHSRRRDRFDFSASRKRNRAVRRSDGPAVRAPLGAWRIPERARHQDVEAARKLSHRPRSARAGRGCGGSAVVVLSNALSPNGGV